MTTLDFDRLLRAVSPGGPSCLSSTTELEPAGGAHTSIAPARYTGRDSRGNDVASYAYEQRFPVSEGRRNTPSRGGVVSVGVAAEAVGAAGSVLGADSAGQDEHGCV